eukprot:7659360-Pyramimonas_sp.AAC.2
MGMRSYRHGQCCRLVAWHRRAPVVFPAAPAVFQHFRTLTYPVCLAYAYSTSLRHSRAGGSIK